MIAVAPLRAASTPRDTPAGFLKVAGAAWMPGVGSAMSSLGYGASAFAFALVATRLFFGHVPDRLGGAKVALACIFVEALGLGLLWLAPGPAIATLSGGLTGFGYSLVYPGLGVEAVRRAPPQSRGLAMGAYTVFLDVALGFGPRSA